MLPRLAKLVIPLALLLLLGQPITASATFRALLIGINYQGADPLIPQLSGAIADMEAVYRLMTGPLGIPAATILTLKEQEATHAAIVTAIQNWLIHETQPGDDVFLLFAGHGMQVPSTQDDQTLDPDKRQDTEVQQGEDLFGNKVSGLKLAEALVPYDTKLNPQDRSIKNLILDRELHILLQQLRGRNVTLWLDNCHSGGTTRKLSLRFRPRSIKVPWLLTKTRVITRFRARGRPVVTAYRYFAAARYFQLANEDQYTNRGLFTQALTRLLQAKPNARYTNGEIIKAVRHNLQYQEQMPPTQQLPVFYGPPQADQELFALSKQRRFTNKQSPTTVPKSVTTKVKLKGNNQFTNILRQAIRNHAKLALDYQHPDIIVQTRQQQVSLYHPTGELLQRLPAQKSAVIQALLTYQTGQQLGAIQNPAAPFQVKLWLDSSRPPGKTKLHPGARVTLYYQVQRLPYPTAYLTLLNLAPDGNLAILYPTPQKNSQYNRWRQLDLTAPVTPGRIHSIPKGQRALRPGEYVAIDRRLRLNQTGQEYFKAIVTPKPLKLNAQDAALLMRRGLTAVEAPNFAARLQRGLGRIVKHLKPDGWGVGDLRVTVQ